MSGTLFTILIEISHYAYFIVLKNCRVLVVIWPTWPVTWDRGYESHWIHKKIEHFFSSTFFSFLVYIYHVHNKYRVFNKKMWKRDHFLHFLTVVYSCSQRKRFNCDQCGKNFARGCYLKLFMKKTLNSIVITMAKISPKLSWIRQNTGLKLKITAVHENKKIKFWSMWQKFC